MGNIMDRKGYLTLETGEINVFGVDYETKVTLHQVMSPTRIVVKWRGKSTRGVSWHDSGGFPTTLMVWDIENVQPMHYEGETEPFGFSFNFTERQSDILIRTDEFARAKFVSQQQKVAAKAAK